MKNYPRFIDGETFMPLCSEIKKDILKHTPTDKWHHWDANQLQHVTLLAEDLVAGKAGRTYVSISVYVTPAG